MGKPQIQHWVPRFYLRAFATPDTRESDEPQVWLFSKDEGDPVLTNIRNVAAARYLYSPKNPDGSRDWAMEERLSGLESIMAPLWPTFASEFVDLGQESLRKALGLMIATLHLRHPRARRHVAAIQRQLVGLLERFPKDAAGEPIVPVVGRGGVVAAMDTAMWQAWKTPTKDSLGRTFVDNIAQTTGTLAKALLKKRWSVIFTEEPVFITTDSPVVIAHPTREVFGMATAGTVISLPLSPTRVLVLDDRHDQPSNRYYPLLPHGPAPINGLAWHHCDRFMISSRQTDLVLAELVSFADLLAESGQGPS